MADTWKRTWAEVNLGKLSHNFFEIKNKLPKSTKICCVVKGNAYGHGDIEVATHLQELGSDWLAVSNIEEALRLRENGITKPILILGYTPADCAEILSQNDISQCVYSSEYATELANNAKQASCRVKIHIKLETGMGRIGFDVINSPEATINEVTEVCKREEFIPEGIFTHLSCADMGADKWQFTYEQFNRFTDAIKKLEEQGTHFEIRHCANSASIIDYPEFALDMVRPGIILYGLEPSHKMQSKLDILPIMTLKTVISHIKDVPADTSIGYGATYVTDRPQKIATLPIGYADGFWISNSSNKTNVLIKGNKFPIIGRICMDQTMIDISDHEDINVGDEVIIFGDDEEILSADDIADNNGTINYEVVCALTARVNRIYVK